jgi:chromosome partitioning protein
VSSRVDYQEAARLGLGVSEYNPEGVAAQEMNELWSSIRRRLRRAPTKPAAKPTARTPAAAAAAKLDAAKKMSRKAA